MTTVCDFNQESNKSDDDLPADVETDAADVEFIENSLLFQNLRNKYEKEHSAFRRRKTMKYVYEQPDNKSKSSL